MTNASAKFIAVALLMCLHSCKCLSNTDPATLENSLEAAEGHYLAGKSAYLKGNFLVAQKEFEASKAIRPDDVRLLAAFGELWHSMGQLDEAAKAFEQAVLLEPKRSSNHVHLGQIYLLKGDTVKSTREVDLALSINPDEFRALETKAELLAKASAFPEARDAYVRAFDLAAPSARVDLVNDALSVFRRANQTEMGDRLLEHAARAEPAVASFNHDWGARLVELTRFEDAKEAFARAALADPKDPELFELVGAIEVRLNNRARAEAAFQKSLQIKERALVHLAWANMCRTQKDMACFEKHLEQALKSAKGEETREVVELASVLASVGRQKDALTLLKPVSEEPDEAKNLKLQKQTAAVAHALGDAATESKACQRVKKLAPDDTCP
jgi:Tfp pilus assembly protein PilF